MLELTEGFMRDPIRVLIREEELVPLNGVRQFSVASAGQDDSKIEALVRICEEVEEAQGVIYCANNKEVKRVGDRLTQMQFPVLCVKSALGATEKKDLINGKPCILVASREFSLTESDWLPGFVVSYSNQSQAEVGSRPQ